MIATLRRFMSDSNGYGRRSEGAILRRNIGMKRRKAIDSSRRVSAILDRVLDHDDPDDADQEADKPERGDRPSPAAEHADEDERAQTGQQQHDSDEDEKRCQTTAEAPRPLRRNVRRPRERDLWDTHGAIRARLRATTIS